MKKDVLETLLLGEKIQRKIKTKRGTFVMTFPLPRDLREIEVSVADMLGGKAEAAFSKEQVASFRAYATLDRVITDSPQWWKDLDSSEDCPDDELITNLYGRYLRFYKSVQTSIKESGYNGASRRSEPGTEDEDVVN